MNTRSSSLVFFQAALLIVAGWFIFSPAFHGQWLWDDEIQITANHPVQDPQGLWKIWFVPSEPDYFPLKSTLQWVEWRLWGGHVLGYHLACVGAHLLSAFLLWRLFLNLGVPWAWLGALLFVVHPLMVESVAWIAEQKNTFSLPPLLLAMLAWLEYEEKERPSAYGMALLWFCAAMLCKSSVVMFPAVLLLYVWWRRGTVSKKEFLDIAPFWALAFMMGLITVWFQENRAIGKEDIAAGPLFSRFIGSGAAVFFYLIKFLIPVGMVPVYPRLEFHLCPWLPFLCWPLLALLGFWFWRRRGTWGRHALLGGGFFLLNLIPVFGLIPMAYLEFTQVADHFAYISLIGCIGLAVAAGGVYFQRLAGVWKPRFIGVIGFLFALLVWQSHHYARVFDGPFKLWTYTLSKNPNLWLPHCNLGEALIDQGRYGEAIDQLRQAWEMKSNNVTICSNLGVALIKAGHPDEAIEPLQQAVKIDPSFLKAHRALAVAFHLTNRHKEEVEQDRKIVALSPDSKQARLNLENALKTSDAELKGRTP